MLRTRAVESAGDVVVQRRAGLEGKFKAGWIDRLAGGTPVPSLLPAACLPTLSRDFVLVAHRQAAEAASGQHSTSFQLT